LEEIAVKDDGGGDALNIIRDDAGVEIRPDEPLGIDADDNGTDATNVDDAGKDNTED